MIEYASFEKLTGATLGNYRLEQFVSQEPWGPVFLAHKDAAAAPYLLRILVGLTSPMLEESYLERFQYQASQLAPLQHPNILPLLDYGSDRGLFYLVSPYLPMRSLHTRL